MRGINEMDVSPTAAVQAVLATNQVQQVNTAQIEVLSKAMSLEASTKQGLLNTLPEVPKLATTGTVGTRLHAIA